MTVICLSILAIYLLGVYTSIQLLSYFCRKENQAELKSLGWEDKWTYITAASLASWITIIAFILININLKAIAKKLAWFK